MRSFLFSVAALAILALTAVPAEASIFGRNRNVQRNRTVVVHHNNVAQARAVRAVAVPVYAAPVVAAPVLAAPAYSAPVCSSGALQAAPAAGCGSFFVK